jgi:hypothetical protein
MNDSAEKAVERAPNASLCRAPLAVIFALALAFFALWIYSPFPFLLGLPVLTKDQITVVIIDLSLLLFATRRFSGLKTIILIAPLVSISMLPLDTTTGIPGVAFQLWASIGISTLILGFLLDSSGVTVPLQRKIMSPVQSEAEDGEDDSTLNWFYGHFFAWCLGGSVLYQVLFVGAIADLQHWAMLMMLIFAPTLLVEVVVFFAYRKIVSVQYPTGSSTARTAGRILRRIYATSLVVGWSFCAA